MVGTKTVKLNKRNKIMELLFGLFLITPNIPYHLDSLHESCEDALKVVSIYKEVRDRFDIPYYFECKKIKG